MSGSEFATVVSAILRVVEMVRRRHRCDESTQGVRVRQDSNRLVIDACLSKEGGQKSRTAEKRCICRRAGYWIWWYAGHTWKGMTESSRCINDKGKPYRPLKSYQIGGLLKGCLVLRLLLALSATHSMHTNPSSI